MVNVVAGNNLHLDSVDRLGSIPIIEHSLKRVENFYGRMKNSNCVLNWYIGSAENTFFSTCEAFQPLLKLIESPLKRLDNIMCRSLDVLEQRLPSVYLPPELMYWHTKEYMNDHLVKPVLKRKDSMKQIRQIVLENSITTFAADRLESALNAGDKFVDTYLQPVEGESDQIDAVSGDSENVTAAKSPKVHQALHHGQRFSRKLKRRLTQRTLAEARALKKQSKEAIHILIYAAELIVTNPKLALAKAKELWRYLSLDEPENQARPTSLEQLIVMLSREAARCLVHVVNFSLNAISRVPRTISQTTAEVVHGLVYFNERLISATKLNTIPKRSLEEVLNSIKDLLLFSTNLQIISTNYLERLAIFLSGRIEAEKITTQEESSNTDFIPAASSAPLMVNPRSSSLNVPTLILPNNLPYNNINGVC